MKTIQQKVDIVRVLKNITKQWLTLIAKDDMINKLNDILDIVTTYQYYPALDDIFNFARFSFENTKVVILGMDPYPTSGDAHGLSFSTKNNKCPASLNRIYTVLIKNGLLKEKPSQFDLSYLAAQGFILLNTALTVENQKPGSHIKHWSSWTDQLIRNISDAAPEGTIWCLWGGESHKKEYLIDKKHTIFKSAHPIAPVKPNFCECDHFLKIASHWPNIIWDPLQTDTDLFTDCSARGNQFKDCKASWGVVCTKGLLKDKSWAGEVKSVDIEFKGKIAQVRPTNIRAEGQALIKAMEIASTLPVKKVRIYSDSHFWIHDMLDKYIPDWIERGSSFTSHKNSDITEQFWKKSQILKSKIDFIFVNAWHDRDKPLDSYDLYIWEGNRYAEQTAEKIFNL